MRIRRLAVAIAPVLALAGVAAFAPSTATASPSAQYAVDVPVCPAPSTDQVTCFSYIKAPATAGTKGSYRVADDARPAWARGPAGGLTPKALASAYRLSPNLDRHGQTVGIVDWYDDPNARANLDTFDAHYGLPKETSSTFRKVNQKGQSSPLPVPGHLSSIEISLDVQAVRAVCHRCKIVLVEANGPHSGDIAAAENTAARMGATEISNSYGILEERGRSFSSAVRGAYFHPKVVVVASTGDDGWYSWDLSNLSPRRAPNVPSFPASSPGVVSVGGTKLVLNSAGARASETVWNEDGKYNDFGKDHGNVGATGSGCSTEFAAPSWQKAVGGYKYANCNGKRLSADVSAVADPQTGFDIYDSFREPGWMTIGGTSLAAPVISGIAALGQGAHGVSYPAETLYRNFHAGTSLHDVTVGGSSYCGGGSTSHCMALVRQRSGGRTNNPNQVHGGLMVDCSFGTKLNVSAAPSPSRACNAAVGLDGPTGLGSPTGSGLFTNPTPVITIYRPGVPTHGKLQTYTVKVSDPAGRVLHYSWHWGDGHGPTNTTHAAAAHRYLKKGTYSLYVQIRDSAGQVKTKFRTIYVTH